MSRSILILMLLAAVLDSRECISQWVTFTSANTSGIQANSVNKIRKALNGNLWFATENGLFFRDVHQSTWTRYHNTGNGIPSNLVNDVFVSPSGGIVIATDNGVSIRSTSSFVNIGVEHGLPSPYVTGITGSNTTQFWVCTYGGGIAQRTGSPSAGYNFTVYSTSTGLPTNFYRCAFRASSGQLWFGTSNHGIIQRVNTAWTQYTTEDGLAGNTILDIIEIGSGNLWLAGTGGLSRRVNNQWESITTAQGLHSSTYYSLVSMDNGEIWAGGENGIDILINGQPAQYISNADGLNSNAVSAICRESTGRVWAGHPGLGASFRENGVWRDMSRTTGLASNFIYSSPVAIDGEIHFGTQGLTTYDGLNWIRNGYQPSNVAPTQMWKTDEGRLWAAGNNFFGFKHASGWSHQLKPDSKTFGLPMTSEGDNTQWYCATDGVYRRNQWGETTKFHTDTHLSGLSPKNILRDKQGRIWIISENGLCVFHNSTWRCHEVPNRLKEKFVLLPTSLALSPAGNPMFIARKTTLGTSLPGYYILELRELLNHRLFQTLHFIDEWETASTNLILASDSSGGIWAARRANNASTAAACMQFAASGETFRHYRTDGIASNRVTGMLDDGNGYMWLTTDAGVSRAPLLALPSPEPLPVSSARSAMSVYPNPSRDFVTIELKSKYANDELVVMDMTGSEVMRIPISLTPHQNCSVQLDLGMLPKGLFLLAPLKSPELTTRIVIN